MTITYENRRIHIKSDVGKCMKNKQNGIIFIEAWLAVDDVPDNWEEIDYTPEEPDEK